MAKHIQIRSMDRVGLISVKRLTDKEEWNMELSYLEAGFDLDPLGWKVAIDDKGEIIGCCAGLILNEDIALMGCFVIDKLFRGQGIGKKLWKATKQRLNDRNIILTATDVNIYIKDGFFPVSEVQFWKYEKKGNVTLPTQGEINVRICELKDVPLSEIRKYDTALYPFDRSNFFQNHIIGGCHFGVAAVDNATGDVRGYGTLRRGSVTLKAFPLYAETDDVARILLKKLLEFMPEGDTIYVSPSAENKSAISILNEVGFLHTMSVTSMYSKYQVTVPTEKIFSVSSHEFSLF